jgi:hypothetical protein
MPTPCSRDLFGYEVVEGRRVVAAFDGGEVTSDAGALLLGATDRAIGLVERFAACFADRPALEPLKHDQGLLLGLPFASLHGCPPCSRQPRPSRLAQAPSKRGAGYSKLRAGRSPAFEIRPARSTSPDW